MKKQFLYIILISLFFTTFLGCNCYKKQILNSEDATYILKNINISENVGITTTTQTNFNGIRTTSSQTDIYFEDKYYHSSELSNILTKTWYGKINNVLYAFYYTKGKYNTENKSSTRIEQSQLDATKKQPWNIIFNLFNGNGDLLPNHTINGTKKGDIYILQISNNTDTQNVHYTIKIKDNNIITVIKTDIIENDSITTTYNYNYSVTDIALPSLTDYPLTVNN